ncbi:hypothetical protein [Agathobacter rectalis]|uniref:Uncharacterized protein n=1 Tax=Agathobacter rectalis TaxID=39491 RepID=A0A3E4YML6_9FIRM|nr:hypothetical protein [Agathobacter rectalis]RGM75514.1 hypothetical protein DXB99_03030 [Agathobacter rectalis]
MSLLKSIKQYMKTGNIKENYTATIPIKDDSVSIELKDVNKTYKTYIELNEENDRISRIRRKYNDISYLILITAFILLAIAAIIVFFDISLLIKVSCSIGSLLLFIISFIFLCKSDSICYIYNYICGIGNLTILLKVMNTIDTDEKIGFSIKNKSYGDIIVFKYFDKDNKEHQKTAIELDKIHYCLNSPNKIIGWYDKEKHKYMLEYWTTYNGDF